MRLFMKFMKLLKCIINVIISLLSYYFFKLKRYLRNLKRKSLYKASDYYKKDDVKSILTKEYPTEKIIDSESNNSLNEVITENDNQNENIIKNDIQKESLYDFFLDTLDVNSKKLTLTHYNNKPDEDPFNIDNI